MAGIEEAMAHKLVIVARQHAELYEYLSQRFATRPAVDVILDRRGEERRHHHVPVARERRRSDRRSRPEVDELLRFRSHVIVTIP